MATNHPSHACSRAAFRLGFQALCLSCVCLGLALASAASLLGQGAAAVHPDSSGIAGHLAAHDTHEPIGNSFALDERGGVYIVSDAALYKFVRGSDGSRAAPA